MFFLFLCLFSKSLRTNTEEAKTNQIASNGWYLIKINKNISESDFSNLNKNYGISFKSENLVHKNVYKMYLNEKQINFLRNSTNFQIKFAKNKQQKFPLEVDTTQKYLVSATKNWVPKNSSAISKHFSQNHFIVTNIESLNDLYKDPEVLSIKAISNRSILNRYEAGYVQSGDNYLNGSSVSRYFAEMGLDGNNQIINFVDSGVDSYHCFFYDPNVKLPENEVNLKHRKIVRVDTWADATDHMGGHGTHVAGSLVGKSLDESSGISYYNGVATGAKLYVTDLGQHQILNDVSADFDLDLTVKRMEEMDSGISSNSWGFGSEIDEVTNSYDVSSMNNPNITYIFAAGNSRNPLTINCPGNCKNVLSVGLVTNPSIADLQTKDRIVVLQSGEINIQLQEYNIFKEYWDYTIDKAKFTVYNKEVVQYSEDNLENLKDKVVLISSENICDAMRKSQEYGAVACISDFLCTDADINLPRFTNKTANDMMTIKTKCNIINITFKQATTNFKHTVSTISSKGPTRLNILKPDVVAPGDPLWSSRAGDSYNQRPRECSIDTIFSKSGTSMATPLISGLATIARQYFMEGWYVTGYSKMENEGFKPTSDLLRALIINAAYPISTIYPNTETGFGLPILKTIIPSKENYPTRGLRVSFNQKIKSEKHHVYKIQITKKTRLCITMSYIDLATANTNELPPILCDIDLVVVTPRGEIIYGNQYNDNSNEHFSTNERVLLEENDSRLVEGTYYIHVLASEYPFDSDVHYSVVVSGGFNHQDIETNPLFLQPTETKDCITNCGKGSCNKNGQCECHPLLTGHQCEEEIKTYFMDKSITAKFAKNERKVFAFPFDDDDDYQVFSLTSNVKAKGSAEYCFSAGSYKGLSGQIVCQIQNTEKETFKITRNEIGDNNGSDFLFLTIFVANDEPTDITFTLSASNQVNHSLFIFQNIWTTILFAILCICVLILIILGIVFLSRRFIATKDENTDIEELIIPPDAAETV